MKPLLTLVFLVIVLTSCTDNGPGKSTERNIFGDTAKKQDTEPVVAYEPVVEQTPEMPGKTTRKVYPKTLAGKAAKLLDELKDSGNYAIDARDTLIDMNGDKYKDILIEFYGSAGTGLKNIAHIYLFNNREKMFAKEPIRLPNPTFNFKNYTLVNYYIANGGGDANELKWHGLRLDTLESIEIVNEVIDKKFRSIAAILDHNTGKQKKKISDMVWLPGKYKYWEYQPIIKRNDP